MSSILFNTLGNKTKASSRVRAYWIAEFLSKKGWRLGFNTRNDVLGLILLSLKIPFYKVIIFQKTYNKYHVKLNKWAKFLNKLTILDIDDAPSFDNSEVTLYNFKSMVSCSSAIFAGSSNLQKLTSQWNTNSYLIPSSLRMDFYQAPKKQTQHKLRLGWIGNGKYYKHDIIEILVEPMSRIAKNKPLELMLIGVNDEDEILEKFGSIKGLDLIVVKDLSWDNEKEVVAKIATFDIGLYPLLPNEFNDYKCGFKALEYLALEIPVVSSDVAMNRSIVIDGETGYIARSSDDWVIAIEKLLEDSQLRKQLGENGRSLVEKNYSTTLITEKIRLTIDELLN